MRIKKRKKEDRKKVGRNERKKGWIQIYGVERKEERKMEEGKKERKIENKKGSMQVHGMGREKVEKKDEGEKGGRRRGEGGKRGRKGRDWHSHQQRQVAQQFGNLVSIPVLVPTVCRFAPATQTKFSHWDSEAEKKGSGTWRWEGSWEASLCAIHKKCAYVYIWGNRRKI